MTGAWSLLAGGLFIRKHSLLDALFLNNVQDGLFYVSFFLFFQALNENEHRPYRKLGMIVHNDKKRHVADIQSLYVTLCQYKNVYAGYHSFFQFHKKCSFNVST